jgi:2EXR family
MKLPLEIRRMIWSSIVEPRVIEMCRDPKSYELLHSRMATPLALRLCRESREEVIKLYPFCLGTSASPGNLRFNCDLLSSPTTKGFCGRTETFMAAFGEETLRLNVISLALPWKVGLLGLRECFP